MKNNSLGPFRFLLVHKVSQVQMSGFGFMAGGIAELVAYLMSDDNNRKFGLYAGLAFLALGISMGIPSLLAEYRRITSALENGIEVPGKIIDLYFAFGKGYVAYEYEYHGQKYRASDNINRTRKTRKLQTGQNVTLRLNQNDFKQAYIPEVYL